MSDTDTALEMRVASTSVPQDLASAISNGIYDSKSVRLRCVGAGAVNQAVKGIILAQQYAASRGLVLATRPGFINVTLDGAEKTGVVFNVFVVS